MFSHILSRNILCFTAISQLLFSCGYFENDDFISDVKGSNFYTCPENSDYLVVCKIYYTISNNQYYEFNNGIVFSIGATPRIKFMLNQKYNVDDNTASYWGYGYDNLFYESSNGPQISPRNGYTSVTGSYIYYFQNEKYIEYEIHPPTSTVNYTLKILSYADKNRAILSNSGNGILESREISFSFQ